MGAQQDRNAQRGKREKRYPLRWLLFFVIGAFFIGVIVLSMSLAEMDKSNDTVKGQDSRDKEAVQIFPIPSKEAILDIVKRGFAAREETEIYETFHLGAATPEQVLEFFEKMVHRDGAVEKLEPLGDMSRGVHQIVGVDVYFAHSSKVVKRLVCLTPSTKGAWKIDYSAFAQLSSPSWKEILSQNVENAEVRVTLEEYSHYEGVYRDENEWTCYRIQIPDYSGLLLGYCKTRSRQESSIELAFSRMEDGEKRFILGIKKLDYAKANQFEITRVYSDEWVQYEDELDEIE